MMIAIVVRHGVSAQTANNIRVDTGLTEAGETQIRESAAKLCREHGGNRFPVKKIFTSAEKRAAQSAAICASAEYLDIPPEKIYEAPNLNPVDIRSVDVYALNDLINKEKKPWFEYWLNGFPGFEDQSAFQNRVIDSFEKISMGQKDDYVLFVVNEEIFWAIITYKLIKNEKITDMLSVARKYKILHGEKRFYLF
ncbi:MAG: histidine phosphatase family protein [Candidatus Falkowbacteria bacterium]